MLIEFIGKVYDNHSLSIVNRNILKELATNNDLTIKVVALDSYDPAYKVDKSVVKLLKSLETTNIEVPDIQVRHSYPPIWEWPANEKTKVVFIQPWEYPKVPFEWQYKFETFADALIVPSNYCRDIFLHGGINPDNIFTVANGYNDQIFNKDEPKESTLTKYNIDKNKFNFVYVGNSQWRKNLSTMLNAWANTFKKYDNARLIIKDNPNIYGHTNILSEIIKLQYKSGCAEIVYIDSDLSDEEMSDIYKASKAIVHPYRAEGFGMHIQEAMACGCVPIVPDKGPTEDFIPEDVGLKIATKRIPINIEDPNIFATKSGDAMTLMSTHTFINEPQLSSLQDIMGLFYQLHDKKPIYDKLNNHDMTNTWKNIANSYTDVFTSINYRKSANRIKER